MEGSTYVPTEWEPHATYTIHMCVCVFVCINVLISDFVPQMNNCPGERTANRIAQYQNTRWVGTLVPYMAIFWRYIPIRSP